MAAINLCRNLQDSILKVKDDEITNEVYFKICRKMNWRFFLYLDSILQMSKTSKLMTLDPLWVLLLCILEGEGLVQSAIPKTVHHLILFVVQIYSFQSYLNNCNLKKSNPIYFGLFWPMLSPFAWPDGHVAKPKQARLLLFPWPPLDINF